MINLFNGDEKIYSDHKYKAVNSFYTAFNTKNISLMKEVWSNTEESFMANPIGGIRKGWLEILEGYKKIFASNLSVYVEFYDFEFIESDNFFIVNGKERGTLTSNFGVLELKIRTSRVFKTENGKWKHIVHHGSIDDPDLLRNYQKIILGN